MLFPKWRVSKLIYDVAPTRLQFIEQIVMQQLPAEVVMDKALLLRLIAKPIGWEQVIGGVELPPLYSCMISDNYISK